MILLTSFSGIALLLFVLSVSLLLIGAEDVFYHDGIKTERSLFAPYKRFLSGRCSNNCPPPCLYASCACLLAVFLFVPMGSLPQFVQTSCDLLVVMFLLISAQSLYIRGMKKFSGELYQSLESRELFSLSRFTVAVITVGGTLSWYVLDRGIPGNMFSLGTFSAMPIWRVSGVWGWVGMFSFMLLFSMVSPCRAGDGPRVKDNVPLPELFDAVRSTICPAMMVALFFPFRYALTLGLSGLPMYALDFAFFWCKVAVVQLLLIPCVGRASSAAEKRLPERFVPLVGFIFAALGATAFMLDLYM